MKVLISKEKKLNKKFLKNIEWSILICVIILIAIGCIALYSATQSTEHDELIKQLIWLGISIPIMIAVIFIDYELIVKQAINAIEYSFES